MGTFLEDCGVGRAIVVTIQGPGDEGPRRQVLDSPAILIGRGPTCHVRLDHPDVSRRHAYIQFIDGRPFCFDLESRTGTHQVGQTSDVGWIDPGCLIRIGPFSLRVLSEGVEIADEAGWRSEATCPLGTAPISTEVYPGAMLEVDRPGGGERIRLARTLTLIGRSQLCRIRLPQDSRFAAALLRTPGGVWMIDLHAKGQLAVNGKRTDEARLDDGDELEVGRLVARIRYNPASGGSERKRTESPHGDRPLPIALAARPIHHGPTSELVPILDQFARMQQETNDHFDRVIVMVSQLFGSMHREMVELVREELAEIRRISASTRPGSEPAESGESTAPAPEQPDRLRDPLEIQAIVGERLAAFEREGQGHWNSLSKILQTLVRPS